MNTPELEYDDACRSGDLAAHVARLSLRELKALYSYATARMDQNDKKGGIPAIVKGACILQAAERILDPK